MSVAAAERGASADATIRAEVPNAIHELLDAIPASAPSRSTAAAPAAFTTGISRAARTCTYLALPSTSPAYARIGFAAKLAQWQALREALLGDPEIQNL